MKAMTKPKFVNGKADYLITGDRDLLVLHPFRDIQILTPADLLPHQKPLKWHKLNKPFN